MSATELPSRKSHDRRSHEAQLALTLEMLEQRFGPLDPQFRARLGASDTSALRAFAVRALSATQLDDVLRRPTRIVDLVE